MQYLTDGPDSSKHLYLFAHGAGAGMDHPFMTRVARLLGEQGIRVVRFEFPYMARRRETGKRGAPDRQPVLLEAWRQAIDDHGGGGKVFIGGKSMGGRMASMVADECGVRGLICLGYPFHAPGKLDQPRVAHLEHLETPTLILQGTRDAFGTREDVRSYRLSSAIEVAWIEGADHSLKGGLDGAVAQAGSFILSK